MLTPGGAPRGLAAERGPVFVLVALFIAGLAPFTWTFLQHYPDERNYTNAAIFMHQTGDYATPRWYDGAPRARKPILTYWVVAASYALFGVSLPASRAPFVLAGAAVVALTWATARRLGADRPTAWLAAAIVFSLPVLAFASMRAIPDVLLCLFMLVSAFGFLTLIVCRRREPHAYWCAYLGAALAVETKGLLAVVFVAFAWAFAAFDRTEGALGRRLRSLVHLPSMAASLAVACGWYIAMAALHGPRPISSFLADQVSSNLAVLDGSPLYRIPAYAALLAVNLLPWTIALVLVAWRDPRSLAPSAASERRLQRFVVLWSLVMAVIFGLGAKVEPRYLLPAAPLGAIALAFVLARAAPELVARSLAWLRAGVLVGLAAFALAVAGLDGVLLGARPGLAVAALGAALTAAVAWASRGPGLPSRAAGVALGLFVSLPLAATALRPALEPDAGVRAMAAELERRDSADPVLVMGPEWLANKLRVASGGRVRVDSAGRLGPDRAAWPAAIILPRDQAGTYDLSGYRTLDVATEARRVPLAGLLHALRNGGAATFVDAQRERHVMALRN